MTISSELKPVLHTLQLLSRKWTIEIIDALMEGMKKFTELGAIHDDINDKTLSLRLKELHEIGIIEKIITNIMPVRAKYRITKKGKGLNSVFYELGKFAAINFPESFENTKLKEEEIIALIKSKYLDLED